jgi:hypothetical protein
MAAYRVDLLTNDPYPVFDWIDAEARGKVVRRVAQYTVIGWHMKVVFKCLEDAEVFHRRWRPDDGDYEPPWGLVRRRSTRSLPQASPATIAAHVTGWQRWLKE